MSAYGVSDKSPIDMTTVDELDVRKYVGLWYEIARYDNPFEKNLVGVTINYVLKPSGDIEMINSGYIDSIGGRQKMVVGKVKTPDKNKPGILKVSFALFFNTEYHILEVEDDYSAALVASPDTNLLWIVSRQPEISPIKLDRLLKKAQERGYNTDDLTFVEH